MHSGTQRTEIMVLTHAFQLAVPAIQVEAGPRIELQRADAEGLRIHVERFIPRTNSHIDAIQVGRVSIPQARMGERRLKCHAACSPHVQGNRACHCDPLSARRISSHT